MYNPNVDESSSPEISKYIKRDLNGRRMVGKRGGASFPNGDVRVRSNRDAFQSRLHN